MDPVLVLHGGAGRLASGGRTDEARAALRRILEESWPALREGCSALQAVVDAVVRLEADPLFNAGTGSKLQVDGVARLSAAVMDGARECFGGVVNLEGLAHPVRLARALLEEDSRVLAGAGALARARELGLAEKDVRTERAIAAWERGLAGRTGTVGAVALDASGRLAAATSTGGRGLERVGRVSDTPTIAANLATPLAAVSLTGVGEDIVDGALGARVVLGVEAGGSLAAVSAAVLDKMREKGWRAVSTHRSLSGYPVPVQPAASGGRPLRLLCPPGHAEPVAISEGDSGLLRQRENQEHGSLRGDANP